MGERRRDGLKLHFDNRLRLQFQGAKITSDAGLLACRELDESLGLAQEAEEVLSERRTGRNIEHGLVALLRQAVYSRLAGYEDTNDAERLAQDPAMRVITSRRASREAGGQHQHTEPLRDRGAHPGGEPGGTVESQQSMGGASDGPHTTPASDPGPGQLGEPGARAAGRCCLQWPFRVRVLSSPVR